MGLQVWGPDAPRRIAAESTWKKPLAWNRESEKNGRERYGGMKDERIRVFCASMADVFEPRPDLDAPRARLFDLIAATPALDWLLLTKRPDLARDRYFAGGWTLTENVWIGTSIENTRFTWRADALREIPANIRFISAEPLLGSLFDDRAATVTPGTAPDLDDALEGGVAVPGVRAPLDLSGIDWVIVGGESGGRASRPMHRTWVREIRDACGAMSYDDFRYLTDPPPFGRGKEGPDLRVAFHFKQWGSWEPDLSYESDLWLSPGGRVRSSFLADATGDLPDGSIRIQYAGPGPKSGGKLLDGREWCEFPSTSARKSYEEALF